MSSMTPSGLERLLFVCAVAATLHGAARADDAWAERLPLQDTFVNYNNGDRDTAYTNSASIVVGNGREGCMMFDVSGLANVTAAKIKFNITQCGTKTGVTWPLYFRVMRNDRWNETTLTWNSLPDEFRTAPAAILATNDASVAGYVEVPAGSQNSWFEVDVTEAVKAAAPQGRLALHVCTSWNGDGVENTPLAFASSDHSDETLRPTLKFTGAVAASASSLTIVASADTHVQSGRADVNFGSANDAVMVDCNGRREAFIKFDLSNVSAPAVDSAVFLLHTYPSTSPLTVADHAYTSDDGIQFELTGKTDWNETTLTWNNAQTQTGTAVNRSWELETPPNAVRGPSSAVNRYYTVDVTTLVNQVLAAGGDTLSLHIWRKPTDSKRYFFICPREYAKEEHRPRLLITPKVDAALTTRTPVQETFVSTYEKDTAYFTWMEGRNWDYLQIGCTGNNVEYGLMLFDPSGLENAEYVRFRVLSRNSIVAGDGALRVAAWTTDAWNATNLTWNTLTPWFPAPSAVTAGTAISGEVANIGLTQTKGKSYFEADVTEAVRAAAQEGKMVTLGLFSNRNWPEFYKGESSYPAVLIFPDPDAEFGNRVTWSLGQSGDTPALSLKWSPSNVAGATYTVERLEEGEWTTVATGLSEATCLDADAKPYETHTYRITETTSGESVTKSFDFAPEVKVFACADTYVQNGGNANTSFGTALSLVHKYVGVENNGGVREALYRFDLSEMPENFKTATLKLYPTGNAADVTANAHFDLYKYPDFEWSDANAPAWNDVFGNGWATQQAYENHPDGKRPLETELGSHIVAESGDITANVPVEFDVADAIRTARAAGDTHVTLHTAAYSGGNWNFGIISREGVRGFSFGAQIVFTLKNWVRKGTAISIR